VFAARGGPRIPQKTSESPAQSQVPSLYESLRDYFPVGAAIEREDITGPHSELLVKHFNSIVAENAMKMGPLQPKEGQFDFATADALVVFARAHHMLVRGHTLVWHRQNPDWLFKDANGNQLQPGLDSKALVLARMQAHIRTVV